MGTKAIANKRVKASSPPVTATSTVSKRKEPTEEADPILLPEDTE